MLDTLRNLTKSGEEKREEALNAYLDNALSPNERRRFEQRLAQDADLRAQLQQISVLKQQLRRLPQRRVPRNFTLDPTVHGRRQRQPLFQPAGALRLATVLTAFFFVLAIAADLYLAQSGPLLMSEPQQDVAMVSEEPAAAMRETVIEGTRVVADEVQLESEVVVETETMAEVLEEDMAAAEEAAVAEPVAEAPVEEIEIVPMPDAAGESVEGEVSSTTVSSFADMTVRAPTTPTPAPTSAAPELAAAPAPQPTATISALPRQAVETVESNRAIGALPGGGDEPQAEAVTGKATEPAESLLQSERAPEPTLTVLRLLQIILGLALLGLLLISFLNRRRRV